MCDRAGFLKDFQPYELELMQERKIFCKTPFGRMKDFGAKQMAISRKVALPAYTEFFGTEIGVEGSPFEFKGSTSTEGLRRMKFTPSDEYSEFFRIGGIGIRYFLRTPTESSPSKVCVVDRYGIYAHDDQPANFAGLLPIIRLSGDAEVSIEPGSEFIHCLTASLSQRTNHLDELMTLLG